MRVITGSARGHRLYTLPGRDTRPTTSRVKEAVMSVIHFEIPGARVVDLFAGTGQLGIETLSRGAESCTFVELSPKAEHVILENLKRTRLEDRGFVYKADVKNWLLGHQEPFNIAFVDPPYDQDILPDVLPLLVPHMAEDGVIVCESSVNDSVPKQVGDFVMLRDYGYGKRKVSVYRHKDA